MTQWPLLYVIGASFVTVVTGCTDICKLIKWITFWRPYRSISVKASNFLLMMRCFIDSNYIELILKRACLWESTFAHELVTFVRTPINDKLHKYETLVQFLRLRVELFLTNIDNEGSWVVFIVIVCHFWWNCCWCL